MGTTPRDTWFDSNGKATFWKSVPLRTVKKAFFKKGDVVRTLMKVVANNITYDFRETAQGGAVIVPPDFTAIAFISPDGRIDYKSMLNGNLGNALTESINTLRANPVPAWDRFSEWLGTNNTLSAIANVIDGCELQTIDGSASTVVGIPDFTKVTDMVSLLEATKSATTQAHEQALSIYQLDIASFGWKIKLYAGGREALSVGFIFRE